MNIRLFLLALAVSLIAAVGFAWNVGLLFLASIER